MSESLRSPCIGIVGHVDTGKTTLNDFLRKSNVQEHEAGGITQEIGSTKFTPEHLNSLVAPIKKKIDHPGFLQIDTPGHKEFSSSRFTAIEMSDFVIVVVNILKGVEEQTKEVAKAIRDSKKPFIIVANMIDKIQGWVDAPKQKSVKKKALKKYQSLQVQKEYRTLMNHVIASFAELEVNCADFNDEKDPKEWIYIVPISAKTGLGVPELIYYICEIQLHYMSKKLTYSEDKIRAHVLNITKDPVHGKTMRVILSNGKLSVGDTCMTNSFSGPVTFKVTQLMVPEDGKEMKDKGKFASVAEIEASRGFMLKGDFPETIISGSKIIKIDPSNEEDVKKAEEKLKKDFAKQEENLKKYDFVDQGVHLHAGSYGTADALVQLAKNYKIPISGISVGILKKEHIIRASAPYRNAGDSKADKLYARLFSVVLMFGGIVNPEVEEMAKKSEYSVKIIKEDVIYHIADRYGKLFDVIKKAIQGAYPQVQPICRMTILPEHIYHKSKPLIFGVRIKKTGKKYTDRFTGFEAYHGNNLKIGSLVKVTKEGKKLILGKVTSIQSNKVELSEGGEGKDVCIRIEPTDGSNGYIYGDGDRADFDHAWELSTFIPEGAYKVYKKFMAVFEFDI